jgi:hypothetical protein
VSDLSPDDPPWVLTTANALRQARQGRPYDPWDWAPCAQADVDAARDIEAECGYRAQLDAEQAAQHAVDEWPARLADAVAQTLASRAARAAANAEHAERRRHGLAARQRQRLARTRRDPVDTEIRADIAHLDPDQRGALARLLATAARATSDTHVTKTLAALASQAAARRTPDATHGR